MPLTGLVLICLRWPMLRAKLNTQFAKGAGMQVRQRIYDYLAGQIRSGRVKPGDRMPTEKEIGEKFRVSRSTVQSVMSRLAHEGLVRRFAGRGTFACRGHDEMRVGVNLDIHNIQPFESEIAVTGEHVTYRLISFSRVVAPEHAARKLGIDAGTYVYALHRLRLVDGHFIGKEMRYFAPSVVLDVPATALGTEGVHDLLRDHLGLKVGRIEAALRAIVATESDAAYLGIDVQSPLLVRSHTLFDLEDRVILHGESAYVEPFSFRYTARLR